MNGALPQKQKAERMTKLPKSVGFPLLAVILTFSLAGLPPLCAQKKRQPAGSRTVATVNGTAITEEELDKAAATELESLEIQKLQYEANYARERHQVLESSLDRMIEERLLAADAARLGVNQKELLAREVESKVKPPTQAEVDAFYEANKSRISQPRDQVLPQIRQYLQRQSYEKAKAEFIEQLKTRYGATSRLGAYRLRIDTAGYPSRGPEGAPVTIVEFSDFQCTYCKAVEATLREVLKNYPKQVRLVYRQYPIPSIHPDAFKAAEASLCAGAQGRFWEMHDLMFDGSGGLKEDALKARAAKLQLDAAAFNACLQSGKFTDRVKQDVRDGSLAGVSGTPALFINGRLLTGAQPYAEIAKVIEEELHR
jgi:protein-disulfide isomerase